MARRRSAGPVRNRIAANDDAPSIGGLIYALNEKPSQAPFRYAAIASVAWTLLGLVFVWLQFAPEMAKGAGFVEMLARPTTFMVFASILVPVAVLWFLALLAWRAEELRLRSSTMTEVAVRLAEPDKMAEQSVASLGQAVRRQVSFMNDAVSRALGRAGELEALVHNEVAALERSYEDNERKIRSLIQELSGERHALATTGDHVSETLRSLGTEVPALIDKLSNQQIKLAHIIQGAGENLTSLESAIDRSTGRLEGQLGERTIHLQEVLEQYTSALGSALGDRTDEMQALLEGYTGALAVALSNRTEALEGVFEDYSRALDTTLENRAQSLDRQLIERTALLDGAFDDRARALTSALETHALTFSETIGRQTTDIDDSLLRGITAVRRSSENITRQSLKAIEGLAGQSDMLRNVSENLLSQIGTVTTRFENQGQTIMRAANALESANYKIDQTLQSRHQDLSQTLDRLSGKANEFGKVLDDYSVSIEGTMTDAEMRARALTEELRSGTESRKRLALEDLGKMKAEADAESERTIEDLRRRFSNVSGEVTRQLGTLTTRFDETSEEMRQHAARTTAELAAEQHRLRQQIDQLPNATRDSAEAMRRALQDQLKALEQLSTLTARNAQSRDVSPPMPLGSSAAAPGPFPQSLSQTLAQELTGRARTPLHPNQQAAADPYRPAGLLPPPPQGAPAPATGGPGGLPP
ncbi:MAG: hypothetical protein ABL908_12565, partial [Hyphomicrobium sp.]